MKEPGFFILFYVRSLVIIAFTVISICGFVLETDRELYEMPLGSIFSFS